MPLNIEILHIGPLKTNCYIISSGSKYESIIIDPGDDAEYIMQKIVDLEIEPKAIMATHGHYDHIMAVQELKLAYGVPFLMHKDDEVLLKWYRKSAKRFSGIDPGPAPTVDQYLSGESSINIGARKLEIIHTPGHTPGGVCLYYREKGILFSGDTIFADGMVGRTDFPYCNKEDLKSSIERLLKLPEETVVYPGHGEETTIGQFNTEHRSELL